MAFLQELRLRILELTSTARKHCRRCANGLPHSLWSSGSCEEPEAKLISSHRMQRSLADEFKDTSATNPKADTVRIFVLGPLFVHLQAGLD